MKLSDCRINGLSVSNLRLEEGVLIAEATLDADGTIVGKFPVMVHADKAVTKHLSQLINAIEKQLSANLGTAETEQNDDEEKPQPLFDGV